MRYLFFLLLVLALVACGAPGTGTPAPTPQAIKILYPAALQPWEDRLANCAAGNPHIAAYYFESDSPATSADAGDIVLQLGQPIGFGSSDYIAQVGLEQVVVIINQANPLSQLSAEQLKQIFSGQVSTWSSSDEPVQVWVFADGDPIRQIFDGALKLTQPLAPEARFAPDPAAMLEAISTDENAIGYLPQSVLVNSGVTGTSNVKILHLEDSLAQELAQPVLAITKNEPVGFVRDLLACLQKAGG